MKTLLLVTDNPENKELVEASIRLEELGFKVFIDRLMDRESLEESENYFSWVVLFFEVPKSEVIYKHLDYFLSQSATPVKIILQEPWDLVEELTKEKLDVYSDWNNLIERNFLT